MQLRLIKIRFKKREHGYLELQISQHEDVNILYLYVFICCMCLVDFLVHCTDIVFE